MPVLALISIAASRVPRPAALAQPPTPTTHDCRAERSDTRPALSSGAATPAATQATPPLWQRHQRDPIHVRQGGDVAGDVGMGFMLRFPQRSCALWATAIVRDLMNPRATCRLLNQARHRLCRDAWYASLFNRPERTLGARGGRRSAHARSRAPLWRGRDHGQTRRGPTARDGLAGAQAHSRLSAPDREGAGSRVAGAAGGRLRCHRAGALRLVGRAVRPAAERGDDVAGDAPAGLDA